MKKNGGRGILAGLLLTACAVLCLLAGCSLEKDEMSEPPASNGVTYHHSEIEPPKPGDKVIEESMEYNPEEKR